MNINEEYEKQKCNMIQDHKNIFLKELKNDIREIKNNHKCYNDCTSNLLKEKLRDRMIEYKEKFDNFMLYVEFNYPSKKAIDYANSIERELKEVLNRGCVLNTR